MGKDPKKPTREPEFVNDVAVTYGTKPGSGIVNPDGTRNNKKTGYWKWTGSDWVKIRQKEYTTLLKNQNYFKNPYGESSICLLYTSPSPRDTALSRMPSSA